MLEKSGEVRIETKSMVGFIQQILFEKWNPSGKAETVNYGKSLGPMLSTISYHRISKYVK
jgi:hypothetical protein